MVIIGRYVVGSEEGGQFMGALPGTGIDYATSADTGEYMKQFRVLEIAVSYDI